MYFSKLKSATLVGLHAQTIDVETDISIGLFTFIIVGLPDKTVEESRERILAAIKNSGFESPKTKNQKILVSLAPAQLRKEGASLDVPIALSYLKAIGLFSQNTTKQLFFGELSLNGELKPLKGALPLILHAKKTGIQEIFIPFDNKNEASVISGITIYGAKSLKEIVDHLNNIKKLEAVIFNIPKKINKIFEYDFSDIIGQETAKRALQISAAGGHSLLLCGPPGTGKTILSKSIISILPHLTVDQSIETTILHSLGASNYTPIWQPPFRSPHHSSTLSSILGGGNPIRPGELSLSHNGVLFLDELPEFRREVLESLREPLEEKTVKISRLKSTERFLANCILLGALNPCPCGYSGSIYHACICTAHQKQLYKKKLSGPFLDRIDLWVNVQEEQIHKMNLRSMQISDNSFQNNISEQISKSRSRQKIRYKSLGNSKLNSDLNGKECEEYISTHQNVKSFLQTTLSKINISFRSYYKIIKIARTIADLDQSDNIKEEHILEALSFRPKIQTLD